MSERKLLCCSATIPTKGERMSLMCYVRTVANEGYSENGDVVTMTYRSNPDNPEDARMWDIIMSIFEAYPVHSITVNPERR